MEGSPLMMALFTIPTGAPNTFPFATANAWLKPRSSPQWARRASAMTTALAKTINDLYKAEVIHRRSQWRTKQSVELATLEWVALFQPPSIDGAAGQCRAR